MKFVSLVSLFSLLTFISLGFAAKPVVLMHGLASNTEKTQDLAMWLNKTFKVKVFNLEIGNGEETSFKTPMLEQLDMFCKLIYDLEELQEGFDIIGLSQGGLLARGYVERCNKYPVRNLITLASPHGGMFVRNTPLALVPIAVRGYWRNPFKINKYLNDCDFLPILNAEKHSSLTKSQKQNMLSLNNLVLVWSENDGVVNPHQSAAFSFFDEELNVIPIYDTEIYKQDKLGLRTLNDTDRFHIYKTWCTHEDHKEPHCYEKQLLPIFKKYIGN
jgi:palmitoyl-protein thioesterase